MDAQTSLIQSTACAFLERYLPYCAPWWERAVNVENLTTAAIAIIGALFGAVVGGLISHYTQMTVLKHQRDRLNEEDNRHLKNRVIMYLMTTIRIKADMENVQNRIEYYLQTALPDAKLWEAVHLIHVVRAFEPDLAYLNPISQLNSSKLLTESMWIYSEYLSIMSTIDQYNQIRTQYIERRNNATSQPDILTKLEKNMEVHVDFVKDSSRHLINQVDSVHNMLFVACEKFFGDADFLRMGDPKV